MTTLPSGHTKRSYARQLAGCARAEVISKRMEANHVVERRVLAALWGQTTEGISGKQSFWRRIVLRWAYKQMVPVWLWDQRPFEACPKVLQEIMLRALRMRPHDTVDIRP